MQGVDAPRPGQMFEHEPIPRQVDAIPDRVPLARPVQFGVHDDVGDAGFGERAEACLVREGGEPFEQPVLNGGQNPGYRVQVRCQWAME